MEKRGKAGTWVWLGAGEHVATITARGASVREPLQKAWLPIERQTRGGGSLGEVSHAKSSSCQLGPQLHVSSVNPLANLCLWITPGHTIPRPEAYSGHYPQVPAATFTRLPFKMDDSHMGPKSSPGLYI